MQDRVWTLDGVVNFRDFGGYPTKSGAQVKRGRLFRSAQFHEATDADVAKLDALGAGFIVDLRRPEERAAQPYRWPGDAVRTVKNDEGPMHLPPHVAVLMETDLTAGKVEQFMQDTYASYPFEARYRDLFRDFLHGLLAEERPAIIHCAAGKDRTGLLAALTLAALETPHDAIVADYEMTNTVVDLEERLPKIQASIEQRLGRKVEAEALRPMIGVRADYLAGAFAAIEAAGGIDRYLREEMALDAAKLAALRSRLVG
jgi:protein tyrosine/serine phosphatase